MGWRDRTYASEVGNVYEPRQAASFSSGMSWRSVTATILIANVVVFFLTSMQNALGQALANFGVMQAEAVLHGQIWRLFTATYLHANLMHILFNMLGLYFLGPALERVWGPRQFFVAYTLGGVAGNVFLTIAGLIGFIDPQTIGVGASGSVLVLLGAAAVLFPDAKVYIYFLFPIRIRTCVIIFGVLYVINVIRQGANYGGDLSHIAGLAVGLVWAYSGGVSLSGRHRMRVGQGGGLSAFLGLKRKGGGRDYTTYGPPTPPPPVERDDPEIDRILAKVHAEGLHSLTGTERKKLQDATRRRQQAERRWRG